MRQVERKSSESNSISAHQSVTYTIDRRYQISTVSTGCTVASFLQALWATRCRSVGWRDPPVLDDPVLLPLVADSVSHQQHCVIDVFLVTVRVVVNTWTCDREAVRSSSFIHDAYSEHLQEINYIFCKFYFPTWTLPGRRFWWGKLYIPVIFKKSSFR